MPDTVNIRGAVGTMERLWSRLTTPSPRITDRGIREQSTLLAWLLVFMFGWVLVMVLTLRLAVMPESGWANPELDLAAANAVCVLVAYEANRRGYYLFAAVLTVGALLAGIIIGTHLSLQGALEPYYSRDEVHILAYLLLPLILGALLLPLRLFVVSLSIVVAGLLTVPITQPHVSWAQVLNGPLLYVGAVGLLLLFVAYVNGVTRRRQYRQLEWREEGYRILFEQSPDAISLVSMDGAIETINQAGLTLFGYLPGEIEGLHASATYANPGDRVALMAKVECEGGLQDEPVRMRKKDGSLMDCLVAVSIRRDSSGRALGFQSIIRDVTERLRVEEDLRLKGELLDLAHDGILLVDPGGEIVYANEATSVLTGYPLSSLVGMNIRGLNTREGAEQVPTRITTMLRQGYAEFETIWVCSDGRRVDVEVRSHTIQSRGRTLFLSVARDVSRRRADEAELRLRSELLDAAQDMVFLHDLKGRLVYANAAVGQLLGYNAGDLVSMDARSLEPSEDASRFRDRMAELFVRHSLAYETNHVCKNGELLSVEVRARIIESEDVIYVLSIARDMRSRKTSEAALRESEERYRSLFELSRDAIYLVQPDGKFINVNQAWLDLLGCTRDDAFRYDAAHWYADTDGRARYLVSMATAGDVLDDEVKLRRKDGSVFDCQRRIVAQRDKDGNTVAFQGVMRDVTETRKAERELRESEAKFRALFEQSMDAVCLVAADGTLLDANQAYLNLYGYGVSDIGKLNARESYVNPSDRDEFLRLLSRDGVVANQEARLRKKGGSVMDCARSAVAQRDDAGHIVRIQTVTRDISAQRKAAQALADELTRRRILVEQSRDGIVVLDSDGEVVEANLSFAQMLGYSPEEVADLHVWDWEFLHSPDSVKEMLRTVDEAGDHFETQHRRKDGTIYDVEISTNAAVFAGRKLIFCVCRDTSARKHAAQELFESEEKYRALFEQSMDAVGVYSVDGALLDANPAHLRLFGLSRDDIGRKNVLALYVEPADRMEFLRLLERDGVVVDQEVRLRKPSGEEMYCVRSAVARRDADGRIVALQTVTRDVTRRKRSEQELRDSEARFRALVEHTGLAMTITTAEGVILDCNDVFLQRLGYTRDEALSMRVTDMYVRPEDRKQVISRTLADGYARDVEVEFQRKDGASVYVSLTSALVSQQGGKAIVSQALDITGRKAVEQELLRSREELQHSAEQLHELTTYLEDAREKERTGIARELHDQLGQALTALKMDLDGVRRMTDSGADVPVERLDRMAALLDETVNDVRRISSDLRPGILDDAGLVAAIEWQLDRFGERSDIKCTLEARADDSGLDRPRSTGLFRVFQELLTNVARHSGATHVWVVFDRDDGNCLLSVSDDGRGITQEQANSVSSLGLIGVRERLRPLGGRIEFLRRKPKGSTVRVIVPIR